MCVCESVCRKDLRACIVTKEIFLNLKNSRKNRKHTLEVNKSIVYIFNLYSLEQCETVKWA